MKKRKPKKRKKMGLSTILKRKKMGLSTILKRKDVKAQLKAAENRGYIRGYDAHKNNFGE